MATRISAAATPALDIEHPTQAASVESTSATTTYHRATVDGVGIFYREAGPKDAPTIVLLHGFPSSSREFDPLIPLLATRYHLIAPDFPGFGQSDAPPPSSYAYTFDNLAKTIDGLLEQLKIDNLHSSSFMTMAMNRSAFASSWRIRKRLQALIIQNANAYKEGLGAKWVDIAQYWVDPKAHPEVFDAFVSFAATEQRHTLGTPHIPNVITRTPGLTSTSACRDPAKARSRPICCTTTERMSRPIRVWQAWLREHKPPTLVVWGRNDPSFISAGAEAFERDPPDAEIHLLDAGHFALDEKNDQIASLILCVRLPNIPSDRSVPHIIRSGSRRMRLRKRNSEDRFPRQRQAGRL